MEKIPKTVSEALNNAAKKYSESPATTNAGKFLRFLSKFITPETVIKLFAHKLKR